MDIPAAENSLAQRQLTVVVGGQSHALPADRLLEVIRRPRSTRVPHGPPALVGVFNLRGGVFPLISLARLMGAPEGAEQRAVVLDHGGPIGLLVDAVPRLGAGRQGAAASHLDLAALLEKGFRRAAASASGSKIAESRPQTAAPAANVRTLVSFLVCGQVFALPLATVREALRLPHEITRVASSDEIVMGVVNVRDRALPLVSLAALLGFPRSGAEATGGAVLVVDHEGAQIGLVVDSIASILRLDEAAIDNVPSILQRGRGAAELDAIGRLDDRSLASILSVSRIFANSSVTEAVDSAPERQEEREDKLMDVDESAADAKEQYLIFELGEERYGIPIAVVDEVLRLPDVVTRLPNAPRFVTGIINLRGRPVPLIDQRERFGVAASAPAARPRVIVVTVGALQAGFVVDGATEIIAVAGGGLAAAPQLASDQSALFNRVANIGDDDGSLILIVDPEELLSRAEQDAIADFTRSPKSKGSR